MKKLSIMLLFMFWVSASHAQDQIKVGSFIQINWFYGDQKNRQLDGDALIDAIFCDPRTTGAVTGRTKVLQDFLSRLSEISSDKTILEKINAKKKQTQCDIRLDVNMVGDLTDRHGELNYTYAWKVSGIMNQTLDRTEMNFDNLKSAKELVGAFLEGLPKNLQCSIDMFTKREEDTGIVFIIDTTNSAIKNFPSLDEYKSYVISKILDRLAKAKAKNFIVITAGNFFGTDPSGRAEEVPEKLSRYFQPQRSVNHTNLMHGLWLARDMKYSHIVIISDGKMLDQYGPTKNLPNPTEIIKALEFASTMHSQIEIEALRADTESYVSDNWVPIKIREQALSLEKQKSVQSLLSKINEEHIPFGQRFLYDLTKLSKPK